MFVCTNVCLNRFHIFSFGRVKRGNITIIKHSRLFLLPLSERLHQQIQSGKKSSVVIPRYLKFYILVSFITSSTHYIRVSSSSSFLLSKLSSNTWHLFLNDCVENSENSVSIKLAVFWWLASFLIETIEQEKLFDCFHLSYKSFK